MNTERVIVGQDSDFIYYEDGTHSFIGKRSQKELKAERDYWAALEYFDKKRVVEQNQTSVTLGSTTFFNNQVAFSPDSVNQAQKQNNDNYDPDLLRLINNYINTSPDERNKGKEPEVHIVKYWHDKLYNIPVYTAFFDWIGKRMRVYSPELCYAATISFFGAKIAGRASFNGEITSNLLINVLAKTATGKSQALRSIKKALRETGDPERQKVTEIKSDGGLKNELLENKACLISIDEVGLDMKKWSNPRSPEPVQNIKGVLLSAFTGYGDEIVIGKRSDKKLNDNESIKNPCPSLFGVSTPAKYWDNLSIDDVSSGLLNRQIIIDASKNDNERKSVINSKTPAIIIEWDKKFKLNCSSYAQRISNNGVFEVVESPIPLSLDNNAKIIWDDIIPKAEGEKVKDEDEMSSIWARLGETTMRFAIQLQLVEYPESSVITGQTMMRAFTQAKDFIQLSYNSCNEHLNAGVTERQAIAFVKEVKSMGANGVSFSDSHNLKTVRHVRRMNDSGSRINLRDVLNLALNQFGIKKVSAGKESAKSSFAGFSKKTDYYVHPDYINEFEDKAKKQGLKTFISGQGV
ncbi:DUF3987 domain-containing protein [Salmonella enterica]|nr:DUF3987 domain-containing protein [Salmonella enterica]